MDISSISTNQHSNFQQQFSNLTSITQSSINQHELQDYSKFRMYFSEVLISSTQAIVASINDVLQNKISKELTIHKMYWIQYLHGQIQSYYLKNLQTSQIVHVAKNFDTLQQSLIKTLSKNIQQEISLCKIIIPLQHRQIEAELTLQIQNLRNQNLNQQKDRQKIEARLNQQLKKLRQNINQQKKKEQMKQKQDKIKKQQDKQNITLFAECLQHLENYSRTYKKKEILKNIIEKITKVIQKYEKKQEGNKINRSKQSSININIYEGKSSSESNEEQKLRYRQNLQKGKLQNQQQKISMIKSKR